MYSACMTSIQIRDVPEDVRDTLATQAAAAGQSLQGFLLSLVTRQARSGRNTLLLRRFDDRTDGTMADPGQTAAEVAEERVARG